MRLLTLARDLRRRRARERHNLFVAEGVRAAAESRSVPVTLVDDADFATAADTESPQGVLAVAEIPERTLAALPLAGDARLLVLDAVQDPGNVGTILRTAAALGAAATLALPGTVDLWNAKVVRSAMGAHFRHPALHCTGEALDAFLATHDVPLWGADARGGSVAGAPRPARLALAVGNEGAGLSDGTRARAHRLVSLPIAADVESLNVAVATGILLYELRHEPHR